MTRGVLLAVLVLSAVASAKPPRLTLFISVDALGSDVLLRHRPRLKAGLARLLNEGAFVPEARYEIAECVTGIGHATMATGTWPWRHGVVGNKVLNRATGKLEACFADPLHPILEATPANDDVSPVNLLAETLSDRLRASTQQRGKAIAISGKGRAAVALAGHLGEAWWYSEQVGKFVTGTWYRKEFPTWVKAFNDRKLPDSYHGKRWELLAPQKEYVGDDERPFESDWYGMGKTFPHPLSGGLPSPGPQSYSALASSPYMSDVGVEFVKAAIEGEQLGKDEVPDLLSVSFSALDRTYHLYGPTSWEMQDAMLRLDRNIGDLLAAAERAAGGKGNLVVVLTADHGGANIPEEWTALGLDGVRVPPAGIQKGLNDELEKRFGVPNLVLAIEEVDVYLDDKALLAKKLDGPTVRRAAATWLSAHPDLEAALAKDDVGLANPSGLGEIFAHSFHAGRSGDVLMVMKPFHVLESEKAGTSHGTPWTYDSHVPLFFWGRGVKPGIYPVDAKMIDVAPTCAALSELTAPASSEGRVLSELLSLPR